MHYLCKAADAKKADEIVKAVAEGESVSAYLYFFPAYVARVSLRTCLLFM